VSADPAPRPHSSPRLFEAGELPPILRDPSRPTLRRRRFNPLFFSLKWTAFIVVVVVFVLPLIPKFRKAAEQLLDVNPPLLAIALALQVAAWYTYSLLTRAALGEAAKPVSHMRMFRIQMSTKALTNTVPGGSAAGPALGYRLLTLSGVKGADAGFALATAGLGSAVVLNLVLWLALMVSIPIRGVNGVYASAALVGVVVMLIAAGLVVGLVHGQGHAERVIRTVTRKLHLNPDKAVSLLRQVGLKVEELLQDRQMLKRVAFWATVNWLIDAVSLWVFLRAFDTTMDPDALLVAFGVANVLAAIPITPGGLGYVDGGYITVLVAFGARQEAAALGVASYRIAQLFLPIVVGGILYGSLRIGPWRIERRDSLTRLRQLATATEDGGETRVDWMMRVWPRRVVRPMPDVHVTAREVEEQARADAIRAIEHGEEP